MFWKFKISDSIHCINFPVEVLHCFDCSLIRNLTSGMNPKAPFKIQIQGFRKRLISKFKIIMAMNIIIITRVPTKKTKTKKIKIEEQKTNLTTVMLDNPTLNFFLLKNKKRRLRSH